MSEPPTREFVNNRHLNLSHTRADSCSLMVRPSSRSSIARLIHDPAGWLVHSWIDQRQMEITSTVPRKRNNARSAASCQLEATATLLRRWARSRWWRRVCCFVRGRDVGIYSTRRRFIFSPRCVCLFHRHWQYTDCFVTRDTYSSSGHETQTTARWNKSCPVRSALPLQNRVATSQSKISSSIVQRNTTRIN